MWNGCHSWNTRNATFRADHGAFQVFQGACDRSATKTVDIIRVFQMFQLFHLSCGPPRRVGPRSQWTSESLRRVGVHHAVYHLSDLPSLLG